MKIKLQCLLIMMLAATGVSSGQNIPVLGDDAAKFTLFASVGALKNMGSSVVTGNVGSNGDEFTGFGSSVLIGTAYTNDATFLSAKTQVTTAYNDFVDGYSCGTTLTVPITGPVTLKAGSYCALGATTITGDLILDGESKLDPTFDFSIDGALSLAGSARIVLINGAKLKNVYFQVTGAVSLGDASVFRGTVVAVGAIELLGTSSLYGRAFSTGGAITLHDNVVRLADASLPVTLTSFNVKKGEGRTALLSWSTTQETNSDRFEIENSANGKSWDKVGTVMAAGESKLLSSYVFTHDAIRDGVNLYRLKMIDVDNTFAYSRIRNLEFTDSVHTMMYPNPGIDHVTLDVENMALVSRIQFVNIQGKVIYEKNRTSSESLSNRIDISAFPAGMYVARITRSQGNISVLKILKL